MENTNNTCNKFIDLVSSSTAQTLATRLIFLTFPCVLFIAYKINTHLKYIIDIHMSYLYMMRCVAKRIGANQQHFI